MIKIDPKSFEADAKTGTIHDVYTKKHYLEKPISAGSTSTNKLSLVEVVAKEISAALISSSQTPSSEIVQRFLRLHFVDKAGNVTTQAVENYLMQTDLKRIIQSFWECVTKVWINRLKNDPKVASSVKSPFLHLDPDHPINKAQEQLIADISDQLSKWNGVRERVPEIMDVVSRIVTVREAITDLTLPFFVGIQRDDIDMNHTRNTKISNLQNFRKIKFRYQDDLYRARQSAGIGNANTSTQETTTEILEKIFNYNLLNGDPRHSLLSSIYAPVCPYCNRQYITIYRESKDDEMTTADLDHFYIKSIYPYLALSLYNFVPSCQICNSRFKGDRDFYGSPHLYPYTQKTNSRLKFSINNKVLLSHLRNQNKSAELRKDIADINTNLASNFEKIITITPAKNTDVEADNSRKTFHLEEVYQSHVDYVFELLLKIHAYNDQKIQSLHQEFSDLFSSEEEVRSMVFGQYLDSEDMIKRPLAKLTQDLLDLSKKGKP